MMITTAMMPMMMPRRVNSERSLFLFRLEVASLMDSVRFTSYSSPRSPEGTRTLSMRPSSISTICLLYTSDAADE